MLLTNRNEAIRRLNKAFSIDLKPIIEREDFTDFLKEKTQYNVDLITSIQTDFITEIREVVYNNYIAGNRPEELINIIAKRGNVKLSRAKLIARDQTSKINGELEKARKMRLGIKIYKWSTAGDERVRESHKVLDGMYCKYDDDTVYSDDKGKTWKDRNTINAFIGTPGIDVQCRCVAISVLDDD